MKKYLQITLAIVASASLIGCKDIEQKDVTVDTSSNAAVQEVENPYLEMHDVVMPVETVEQGDGNIDYSAGSHSQNIDYGKIVKTEQGMAALEQGRQAVVSAATAIDRDQVENIASQLKARATSTTAAFRNSADKTVGSTGIQTNSATDIRNIGSDWKRAEITNLRILDGDTVDVVMPDSKTERIRLVGIDAPESSQLFGDKSTQMLEECIGDKPVSIFYKKRDPYNRLLGIVAAGDTDCNYVLVAAGGAWHYKHFQKDQPKGHASFYAKAETEARSNKKGLWAYSNPKEPWNFRHSK